MRVELISVPYDSGRRGVRMGAGPEHLLESGLSDRLATRGHDAAATLIELPEDVFLPENQAAFELDRRLALRVRSAVEEGSFPLVLSGNCITSIGTIAGVGVRDLGVVWLDAHADFNTPDTTLGGFLDGMALAIVTGRCWQPLAATVPGFQPVDDRSVMLLGSRHLDPAEHDLLTSSDVERLSASSLRDGVYRNLGRMREHTQDVYLHIDMDILDPAEGRANGYAEPNGLLLGELRRVVSDVAKVFRVRAAAITAYDPAHDIDGRVCEAAIVVIETLLDAMKESTDGVD